MERRTCRAPDGVTIVYSASGAGDIALVFIHGGLADRSVYDEQLRALADRYRVLAPDLAGHGESGVNRTTWGIPQFGADVSAVVEAEDLRRVFLLGNSLGGPVAVEAALLLPDRVLGIVGIDTFQNLGHRVAAEQTRQRAEAFRADFAGTVRRMVETLFHADAAPSLRAAVERRMLGTAPGVAHAMFLSMAGYEPGAAVRKLAVPLRAINGDLFPTDVDAIRKIKGDFEAVVMQGTGHFPMLERPAEFNRHVDGVVQALARVQGSSRPQV